MKRRGKQVQIAVYVTMDQAKRLLKLRQKTRVPVAAYIREGIDAVLRRYECSGR